MKTKSEIDRNAFDFNTFEAQVDILDVIFEASIGSSIQYNDYFFGCNLITFRQKAFDIYKRETSYSGVTEYSLQELEDYRSYVDTGVVRNSIQWLTLYCGWMF